MRLCSSRSTSSLLSTTVTSLSGSRARLCAVVRPTWPAPSINTFMTRPARRRVSVLSPHHFQVGVGQHQPLRALLLEVHLHARLRALAFEVEDHAIAEAPMAHACAQPDAWRGGFLSRCAELGRRLRGAIGTAHHRSGNLDAR